MKTVTLTNEQIADLKDLRESVNRQALGQNAGRQAADDDGRTLERHRETLDAILRQCKQ